MQRKILKNVSDPIIGLNNNGHPMFKRSEIDVEIEDI